jgi:hypothetical protein
MRATVSTLCAFLVCAACGGGSDTDAGFDAGIVVPDLGPADAGAPDEGPADLGIDLGIGICGDTTASTRLWAPLPDTCLPRCSAETRALVDACTTDACRNAARAADTTPSTHVRASNGVWTIACASAAGPIIGCDAWQTFTCQGDACPTEFQAWTDCINAGAGGCGTLRAALDACTGSSAAYATCETDLVGACFAH